MDQAAHVVLVSSPGLGHLNHFLELGNRISSLLDVHVTILAVTSYSLAENETIQAAKDKGTCEINELDWVNDDPMEPEATRLTRNKAKMGAMASRVREVMKSMKQKPTVMIVGVDGTELMSILDVGVMFRYVYFPSHDFYLGSMSEGLVTFTGDGFLLNIWEELQGTILGILRESMNMSDMEVPVYPIGPITNELLPVRTDESLNSILEWLNNKRDRSVVFVCLESYDHKLSLEQKIEIAWGLKLSGQNFLCVRSKYDDQVIDDDYLPNGFLDPTQGLVVKSSLRLPQAEILSHRSIGGYLSACSGHIVLESLTKGVPIIAWPFYPVQEMNAIWATEEMGAAIRTSGLPLAKTIGQEEVASLVKKIVEDEEIRAKAEEVKARFEQAWTPDGCSHSSLLKWATKYRLA